MKKQFQWQWQSSRQISMECLWESEFQRSEWQREFQSQFLWGSEFQEYEKRFQSQFQWQSLIG